MAESFPNLWKSTVARHLVFLKLILWHLWVSCVWNASIIIITSTTLTDIKLCIFAAYMNDKLVWLSVFELCYYLSK